MKGEEVEEEERNIRGRKERMERKNGKREERRIKSGKSEERRIKSGRKERVGKKESRKRVERGRKERVGRERRWGGRLRRHGSNEWKEAGEVEEKKYGKTH